MRFYNVFWLVAVHLCHNCFAQPLPQIIVNGHPVSDGAVTYGSLASVTMSGFAGGHIFYTTNGAPPTISSPEYTGEVIRFTNSFEIRALAYDAAFAESSTRDVHVTLAPLYLLRLSGATKYIEYSIDGAPFAVANGPTLNVGSNQVVSLRAAPGDGWLFDRWKGRRASFEQTNTFRMDRTHEVHLSMYRTNELVFPVAGDGEVIVSPPPPYYWDGDNVQVTAIPHAGNFFAGWNLPQSSPEGISFNQKPDAPLLTATFSPLLTGTHAISVRVDGLGTVVEPARYFAEDGATVKITVQPAVGWSVTNFTGDVTAPGTNQSAPYGKNVSVTLDSDKSVVAHANKIQTGQTFVSPALSLFNPTVAPNGLIVYQAVNNPIEDGPAYIVGVDQDGFEQWETSTRSTKGHVIVGLAIGPDGTIFEWINTLGNPGEVNAYSSDDGRFLWQVKVGITSSLAVSDQGVYVCWPNTGRALRRYDLAGNLIREANNGAFNDFWFLVLDPNSNPATTGADFVSYTPTLDLRWTKPNPTYPGGGAPAPIVTDRNGNIISGDLKALSFANGGPLWPAPYTSGVVSSLGTNRVYISDGAANGSLAALDLATGQKVWNVSEPFSAALTTSAAANDGSVFAISGALLRKVSAAGEIVWEAFIAPAAYWPVLTPDGKMYFGTSTFDVAVGPAPSGFPMARGDWMNSGKAYTGTIAYVNRLAASLAGRDFRIRFTPVAAGTLTLQWSDDLVNWNTEKTFTGALDYTITEPNEPHRFYRVIH